MSVEQQVKEVIAETLSMKPEEIDVAAKLSEAYDLDSTEAVDLRVALEKKFGIKLETAEVAKTSTTQEIITAVAGKSGS